MLKACMLANERPALPFLALDLDETLLHTDTTGVADVCTERPYARVFLRALRKKYTLILYTLGTRSYARAKCRQFEFDQFIPPERMLSRCNARLTEEGDYYKAFEHFLCPSCAPFAIAVDDHPNWKQTHVLTWDEVQQTNELPPDKMVPPPGLTQKPVIAIPPFKPGNAYTYERDACKPSNAYTCERDTRLLELRDFLIAVQPYVARGLPLSFDDTAPIKSTGWQRMRRLIVPGTRDEFEPLFAAYNSHDDFGSDSELADSP